MARFDRFFCYARERYTIFLKRSKLKPPPWTDDPILRKFRFCNVFREDDKTTRWFQQNVRALIRPGDRERHVRAAVVFRMINKVETGEALADLLLGQWSFAEFRKRLVAMQKRGKIISPAYMIITPKGISKSAGIAAVVKQFERRWDSLAGELASVGTLEGAWRLLRKYKYIGPFMAYEMVTDLRHTPVLAKTTDIATWANAGPGALRGLARMGYGRKEALPAMREILAESKKAWPAHWPRWEMRDVEHNLCEFDKYERVRNGDGRMKRRYP